MFCVPSGFGFSLLSPSLCVITLLLGVFASVGSFGLVLACPLLAAEAYSPCFFLRHRSICHDDSGMCS